MANIANYGEPINSFLSIPRTEWVVTKDSLKMLWKDHDPWNEIFEELVSPEEYDMCIIKAVMRFNGKRPYSFHNPKDFPKFLFYLLLKMSMYEVLDEVVLYKVKNLISGDNQGLEMSIHGNVPLMISEKDKLRAETDAEIKEYKSGLNWNNANSCIYALPPMGMGGMGGR